ncbi:MAG TPA: hypothetical protein VGM90_25335 [Kofleriaceae bacterium]|jgi:hypothetical protein
MPAKKPAAKKPAAKKPAAKKPAVSTQARWADEGFKIRAALTWLGQQAQKKELDKAVAAHVGDDDAYTSDAMREFLVSYPLDGTQLASLRALEVSMELITKIIPDFEGYPEPFPIESWTDLAKLPAFERVEVGYDDAVPSAADVKGHPAIREIEIACSTSDKKRTKALEQLVGGTEFAPGSRVGERVRLVRDASGFGALLVKAPTIIPTAGYKKGKAYQLDLLSLDVVDDALKASFRLYTHDANGGIANEARGDLVVLGPKGTEEQLKANAKKLDAYIVANRALPTSL